MVERSDAIGCRLNTLGIRTAVRQLRACSEGETSRRCRSGSDHRDNPNREGE
jgi:hypothetical protein